MIMLQPYLYEIIHKLIKERKEKKIAPYVAIETEVIHHVVEEIRNTLCEMEKDGLICHNVNINGIRLFRDIDT